MLTAKNPSPTVSKSESGMMIRVYNTLSKTKEPLEPAKVVVPRFISPAILATWSAQ